jgi:hypothetical protein
MNDIEPRGPVPTNVLAKQGVAAVAGLAGGIGLFVLRALHPIIGIVAGAVVGVLGIGAVLSRDPDDRKPGILLTASGVLTVLSKVGIFGSFAASLLGIGAIGLLGLGIWNGIKFLKGLKSRR